MELANDDKDVTQEGKGEAFNDSFEFEKEMVVET